MPGDQLVVDRRYEGFPDVALGGYVGGALARMLAETVAVSFKAAPPVSASLEVAEPTPDTVVLSRDGDVIAEARRADLEIDVPAPVTLADAEQAADSFPGHHTHPCPGCFTCGPDRRPGDGLRIFPGQVADRELVAAPWTPDSGLADPSGAVLPEFAWAALDCPQLWALMVSDLGESGERAVTGTMTGRIDSPLQTDTAYVVMAWPVRREGRRLFAGGAILSGDGKLMVVGEQRAVVVPGQGVPLGLRAPAA